MKNKLESSSIYNRTMMDDKLLESYFLGEVTDQQAENVTNWLSVNEINMKHYHQLCRLYELSIWDEKQVSVKKKKPLSIQYYWKSILKFAAVFILGFMLKAILEGNVNEDFNLQTVNVPAGQTAQVILADGSKVWLNAGSSLQFPTRFEDVRSVKLKGEGFFEVQADKKKPFIVLTPKYAVKAIGTSFNVNDYKQSSVFETALLKGKVEIEDLKGNALLQLSPNKRVLYQKGSFEVLPIYDEQYYLWRKGILYFNAPLNEIFKKLELYFNVNILVNKKSILKNDHHCIGKFRTRDGLEHILKVLQLNNPFEYEKIEDENTIVIH